MSGGGLTRKREDKGDPNLQPELEGRQPPHDLNAEQATLSAVMVDPNAIDLVIGWLRAEMFYSEAHRRIFEAACDLRNRNQPTDSVAIAAWLAERDRLAQVGGMPYLAATLLAAQDVSHVEHYGRIVLGHFRVRAALLTCRNYAAKAYLDHGSADEYLAALEADVIALGGAHETRKHEEFGAILEREFSQAARDQETGRLPGIPRGLLDYDAKTQGLHPGDVEVIAARPGMGKTALALCVALGVCRRVPELVGDEAAYSGVAMFSLEMPRQQLAQRALCIEARVELSSLRSRTLSPEQWQRLANAGRAMHTLPMIVDDTPGLEITALRAKIRRIKATMARPGFRHGARTRLRVVIVDYVQLLRARDATVKSREQEVSLCSRTLKEIAKDEDVAVVVLAQLNRALEARSGADRRPRLSDLRESGAIEQDADCITFVHREEHYGATMPPGEEGKSELIIGKQRNGPTGTVYVRYRPGYTAFENM